MKRSHNYSSSDSELDDNVDVEKDSGDENRCDRHSTQLTYAFVDCLLAESSIKVVFFALICRCFPVQSSGFPRLHVAFHNHPSSSQEEAQRGASTNAEPPSVVSSFLRLYSKYVDFCFVFFTNFF